MHSGKRDMVSLMIAELACICNICMASERLFAAAGLVSLYKCITLVQKRTKAIKLRSSHKFQSFTCIEISICTNLSLVFQTLENGLCIKRIFMVMHSILAMLVWIVLWNTMYCLGHQKVPYTLEHWDPKFVWSEILAQLFDLAKTLTEQTQTSSWASLVNLG